MFKNVAGQKWQVFAFQSEAGTNPGDAVTGDAANITANLRLDGGVANAVDDLHPSDQEDGYYVFDISQVECDADLILMAPESSTPDVIVIGVPGAIYTTHNIGLAGAALTDLGGMSTAMKAEINTEVDGALDTAIPELSGDPGATPTIREALMLPFMALRNKRDTASASDEIHNNAGSVILTAVLSDDTITYIKAKYA